jgi:uncharacterized protein (DUF736 family)
MKSFTIFKNTYKEEGSNKPDYKMMVALREGEPLTEIGGCWLKEGKTGKYFSCKLNDAYADHTKNVARKGFKLAMEEETEHVQKYEPMKEEVVDSEQPPF